MNTEKINKLIKNRENKIDRYQDLKDRYPNDHETQIRADNIITDSEFIIKILEEILE